MAEVILHCGQGVYPNIPSGFVELCRITPASQSFYGSVSYALITQICRLKNSRVSKEPFENVLGYLSQGISSLKLSPQLNAQAQYFQEIIKKTYELPLSSFEIGINKLGTYLAAGMRVILAAILTSRNEISEANNILNYADLATNGSSYLSIISSSLSVAVELLDGSDKTIIFEGPSQSERLMIAIAYIPMPSGNEYAVALHSQYKVCSDTQKIELLNGYPFTYSKSGINRVPTNPLATPIPTFSQLAVSVPTLTPPPSTSVPSSVSELLSYCLDILIDKKWVFSIEEAKILKPIIQKIYKNPVYNEKISKVYKSVKKPNCEHNFKQFAVLECGVYHCIQCISDEIKLKTLDSHQIFCGCKKKLNDAEISYYFDMKLSKIGESPPFLTLPMPKFPPDNKNIDTKTITQIKFCTTCGRPIKVDEIVENQGKLYHKRCLIDSNV